MVDKRRFYADDLESKGLIPEYKLLKKLGNGCKDDNIDQHIKNSFGNAIGKIAFLYYKKVDDLCTSLNIYAYELYAFSTATIVYYGQKPKNLYREYLDRQREKKELLYWLTMNVEYGCSAAGKEDICSRKTKN